MILEAWDVGRIDLAAIHTMLGDADALKARVVEALTVLAEHDHGLAARHVQDSAMQTDQEGPADGDAEMGQGEGGAPPEPEPGPAGPAAAASEGPAGAAQEGDAAEGSAEAPGDHAGDTAEGDTAEGDTAVGDAGPGSVHVDLEEEEVGL